MKDVDEGKRQLDKRNILSVLQFTTRILLPKYPYSVFPILTTLYIAHQNREKKRQRLQLRSLPTDIHSKLITKTVKGSDTANAEVCVLVSFNVLEALDISTCSWQKLSKAHHKEATDEQIEARSYLVHVVAIPDIEDSTAFVTNVMHHNITETLHLDSKTGYVTFEASTSVCKKKPFFFIPHIASKAVVSLRNTPSAISSDIVDVILTRFFQKPRYLCQGDIFEIDVNIHAPDIYLSNYEIKFLYFKIVELTGPDYEDVDCKDTIYGFYVVKDLTTLVQVTNQQGYLPKKINLTIAVDEHLTVRNLKSHLLNICPFGLDSKCKELIMCIKPFFNTKARKDAVLRPLILLSGPRGAGKCEICNCSAQMLGINTWMVDSLEQQGNTPGFAEGRLKFIFGKAAQYAPCIVVLKNIEALCKGGTESRVISCFADEIQKLMQELKTKQYPVVVVATTNTKNETSEPLLPPALGRLFLHTVHLSSPSENERKEMLDWILKKNGIKIDCEFSLSHIAARSSGFLYADLKALVSQAIKVKYKQLRNVAEGLTNMQMCLSKEQFEEALDIMHAAYSDAIGAPKIPKVTWNDVGGLENLKEEIMRTVMMPLQHPELAASGLRRSGILLYGPPGTGKTLLAKAVATECNLNFLSVKGPELLNMYVGQSEENVREVFGRARAASPCIIFFDELDSLAPNRGRSGDSGGVMDRVVSQLLAEMDGLQKSTHLFVIGATNRPDLIDPALLRPGRFDKLLYVGVCENNQSKLNVLIALTRRFCLHKDVNLEEVVSQFPAMLTGADIYSICSGAWLSAVRTRIHHLEKYDGDNADEPIEVTKNDFEEALKNFTPSVSTDDLLYFRQLQKQITRR